MGRRMNNNSQTLIVVNVTIKCQNGTERTSLEPKLRLRIEHKIHWARSERTEVARPPLAVKMDKTH